MRKTRLIDCNPEWVAEPDGITLRYLKFDCPEGHEGCMRTIPVTPSLDGKPAPAHLQVTWQRTGDLFETITLMPSIRGIPRYANRDEAIAAGCIPKYLTASMYCAVHIFIRNGEIEFCGDSR